MKVSLNWLNTWLDLQHFSPEEIGEMLTGIGLEVEGMEKVESIPGGLQGVMVGEVKTCGKHPNADRLSVTTVDIGKDDLLHIVCGAPNVAAGQKVMVATVGTTLYPIEGDPITLKKGKIRGEVSEGMICAEDELGIGQDHSGILVLPREVKIGMPAAEYFQIETDIVYEIGLTPNRSDATCHLGVARDLAAYLTVNRQLEQEPLRAPQTDLLDPAEDDPIAVVVENPEACPRYAGLTLRGLKVGESPDWLKNRLQAIGLRPKNNVVDVTNFILHDLGQPLHAFDAAHLADRRIRVKTLPAGTPFVTLDEVERKLDAEDLMICDGQSQGHCIAGVFGGLGSGVTEHTTEIFLESAHFNPQYIRRTSMRQQLRTDAAKVFEKGSDPNMVVPALKRAALLILELAGGEMVSELIDIYPNPVAPVEVRVRYERINRLIGHEIAPEKVREILRAMATEIRSEEEDALLIAVPTNKSDVLREVDVIEEIVRIYGLDNVPLPEVMRFAHAVEAFPSRETVQQVVSDLLAGNGFREMMALSLSQSGYYRDTLPREEEELVFINNTSNVHLDIMRPDMLISALEAVRYNQNRQQTDLRLFEFGKVYFRREGELQEEQRLSLTLSGRRHPESWTLPGEPEMDFFSLKSFVELVLGRLGLNSFQLSEIRDGRELLFGLHYHRGPQSLVTFGKVQPALLQGMEIRQEVYFADFNWDLLLRAGAKPELKIEEPGKYPSMRRDLALVVDRGRSFSEMEAIARKTEKKILQEVNLFDVYENEEQLGKHKKSYALSYLFRHPERTLKDKEVDKIMSKLIQQYETQLGAQIRR